MMSPAILSQLRMLQEHALTELVVVERLDGKLFNESTGLMEESFVTVYEGPGSVVSSEVTETDTAGRLTVRTEALVNLPVESSEGVREGDRVTVTGSSTVPAIVGVVLRVTGRNLGGWRTLRRFNAEEVS